MSNKDNKMGMIMMLISVVFAALFGTTLIIYNWDMLGLAGRIGLGILVGVGVTALGLKLSLKNNNKINQSIIGIGLCTIHAILIVSGYMTKEIAFLSVTMALVIASIIMVIKFKSSIIAISSLIAGYISVYVGISQNIVSYSLSVVMSTLVGFAIMNALSYIVHIKIKDNNVILADIIVGTITCIAFAARVEEEQYIMIAIYSLVSLIFNSYYLRNANTVSEKLNSILNIIGKMILILGGIGVMENWQLSLIISIYVIAQIMLYIKYKNSNSMMLIILTIPFIGITNEAWFAVMLSIDALICIAISKESSFTWLESNKENKIGYLIISAFMIVVSSLIASDVYNINYVFSNRQYRIQGDLLSIEDMVMLTIMVVNMIVSMGVMFNLVYKTVANQISAFMYHKVLIILGVAAINSVGDTLARIDELLYGNLDILTPNFDAISNTILALAWLSVMQLNYRVHRRNSSIAVKNVKKYKLIYIDSLVESMLSILPTLVASILLIVMYDTEVYNASIGVSIICSTIVVLGILSLERNMFGTFRNFCRDNKIAINITEAIRGITEVAIMNYGIVSISQAVVDDGTGLSIIATIANMICTMILLAKQYGNIKAYNEISSTYVVTYSISVVASVIWCISIDSILIPFGMLVLAVGSFVLGYMMINKEKIYNKQINKG